jgi:hypothetical protein
MRVPALAALSLALFPAWALAQDPARTDAGKYTVMRENERVRVLRYHDRPGDKTSMHAHPDFVLYALSSFRRRLTLENGKVLERDYKAGDVQLLSAQRHIGENTGSTDTEVLIVELKEPPAARPAPVEPTALPGREPRSH